MLDISNDLLEAIERSSVGDKSRKFRANLKDVMTAYHNNYFNDVAALKIIAQLLVMLHERR